MSRLVHQSDQRRRAAVATLTVLLLPIAAVVAPSVPDDGARAAARPPTRPNIVLVLTDDQTYDSIEIAMPYLDDEPFGDWTTFERGYVNTALCCPTRSTLLGGQHAFANGVVHNSDDEAPQFFNPDATLVTAMQAEGYQTALFGKYFNGWPWDRGRRTIPPGWSHWAGYVDKERYVRYELNVDGRVQRFGISRIVTPVLTDLALDFIDRAHADGDPFFAYIAHKAPHKPRIATPANDGAFARYDVDLPPNFSEENVSDKPAWIQDKGRIRGPKRAEFTTELRDSYETLLDVDDGMRRLMRRLNQLGIVDDTVIVFMTDNGYSFGSHRFHGKKCGYEECVRTPLMIRYPGAREDDVDAVVGTVDIAATLADLAGIEPPAELPGDSVVPLIEGDDDGWREHTLLSFVGDDRVPGYYGLVSEDWKYLELETGEVELYDLDDDPHELVNLAGRSAHAATRRALADELDARTGGLDTRINQPLARQTLTAGGDGRLDVTVKGTAIDPTPRSPGVARVRYDVRDLSTGHFYCGARGCGTGPDGAWTRDRVDHDARLASPGRWFSNWETQFPARSGTRYRVRAWTELDNGTRDTTKAVVRPVCVGQGANC